MIHKYTLIIILWTHLWQRGSSSRSFENKEHKNYASTNDPKITSIIYMDSFTTNMDHHKTPLQELLKKDAESNRNPSLENIYNDINERIFAQTTLVYYINHTHYILQVDASGYGLGATLLQEGRLVTFISTYFSPGWNQICQHRERNSSDSIRMWTFSQLYLWNQVYYKFWL